MKNHGYDTQCTMGNKEVSDLFNTINGKTIPWQTENYTIGDWMSKNSENNEVFQRGKV